MRGWRAAAHGQMPRRSTAFLPGGRPVKPRELDRRRQSDTSELPGQPSYLPVVGDPWLCVAISR